MSSNEQSELSGICKFDEESPYKPQHCTEWYQFKCTGLYNPTTINLDIDTLFHIFIQRKENPVNPHDGEVYMVLDTRLELTIDALKQTLDEHHASGFGSKAIHMDSLESLASSLPSIDQFVLDLCHELRRDTSITPPTMTLLWPSKPHHALTSLLYT
ncbi:hypothetical protein TREMEDRAFT_61223 [Tremella mesenterica DSM 1558]|uniref:uncharacterized protein n=1 Tax=Tremella mesenterica (strain ATCC 24925 / CBS 8224 / DSM 1558 / NBRC 9311 / NRRL Y-6157 / RJB 2259-6 / UBC 559-6) TaxID=578456 RepID=UPI0003F48CCC|nr:uncharacterized protein TREMEDRAFT_61223 [Tremella mesenterica DSM 1558]EIW70711.1 hypothetical protein TREMEDRAFT_61223 [Tremella mesenterica DSM 1558]